MTTVWDYTRGLVDDVLSDYPHVEKFVSSMIEEVFQKELNAFGGPIVTKESGKTFFIVGDIHGDLETLKKILAKINVVLLKEGSIEVVFLGDYVDRGPDQLECLLSVLALKREFPDRVTLLRGNHEPPSHLLPVPHDFPYVLKRLYGYVKGSEIYRKFLELFDYMPLVLHVKNVFVALHGGLPTQNYNSEASLTEYFLGSAESDQRKLIEEILWNDPIDLNIERSPSPRGAGYLFGPPVTQWFMKRFKIRLIVRGHEPSYEGFKLNHRGRVVTLFSRVGEPYYNRYASFMSLDTSATVCLENPMQCIHRV